MNILFVVDEVPTPDRNSADFRLSLLMSMLCEEHEVWVAVLGQERQAERLGAESLARYRERLSAAGVRLAEDRFDRALGARRYGAVVFEWHFPAVGLLDLVRFAQPHAHVLIDSVDVVFNRLEAKARVTGQACDREHARRTRSSELGVYARSDLVIAVTDADAVILGDHAPAVPTFTIPNIHPLAEPAPLTEEHRFALLFIGSYARPGGETNIDAMRYFCSEVMPLIVAAEPRAELRIIGGPRSAEIDALAGPHVRVLGFVPDTLPYLQTSGISIAPLRFGGGMKGKIGEAMSHALPVVTTSIGVEGFGLVPGRHALVGDTAIDFADHVVQLLRDRALADRLRMAGYGFIRERFSDAAVRERVHDLFRHLHRYPIKRVPLAKAILHRGRQAWHRHVGWRLGNP